MTNKRVYEIAKEMNKSSKEIVDKAVAHSEKGGLKKAFSIITSRRYDEDDYIILREKDFD